MNNVSKKIEPHEAKHLSPPRLKMFEEHRNIYKVERDRSRKVEKYCLELRLETEAARE